MVQTWPEITVKDQAVSQEGLSLNVGICLVVFYDDDGMIGAQDSEWIQNALSVFIGLFRQYRLVADFAKYWTMTYQPIALWSGMSEEVVGQRCTGVGASYHEKL